MNGYLLDTHIWFWYLTASDRLPAISKQLIQEFPESIWLSPVSVWEVGVLQRKGRIGLDLAFEDWVIQALSKLPIKQAKLDHAIARLSVDLDLPHPDPADRFIAATSLHFDLVLLTVDRRLIGADWLKTISG